MGLAKVPTAVVLHLVDKFGNACESGGVRIDAKVTYYGTANRLSAR